MRSLCAALGLGLLLVAGNTTRGAIPPLNPHRTTESHPGKFEWADLFTSDIDTAEHFYSELFGWNASGPSKTGAYRAKSSGKKEEYIVLYAGDAPVAGLVQRRGTDPTRRPARWIGYAAVADISHAAAAVTEAGGKVLAPAHSVPSRGHQAIIADTEGAVIGLLQSSSGDTADQMEADGRWTWFELFARSPRTTGNFYRRVLDYDIRPDTRSSRPDHYVMMAGEAPRAGIEPLPTDVTDAAPDWIGFVKVSSLDSAVAKVTSLGGEVIEAPQPAELQSRFALVADPTGGVFGLVEFVSKP